MAQGKVGSLYFTLGVNASDFEKKLNMATAKIADFGKNAERVGRSLSMSLTLPLSLLGGAAAKTAMDFETSMAKIEGLVGVAGDEVRAMGDEARKMAVQMGKSGNEAAEALFFITSAGLRGKEAMDVLAASMKASVAGLGETKVVADLATSAVNAYGSANIGAVEATDVMVAAVREGKLETQELAGSMGRVLPLASAMGVSFNEVGAAFAALSRTGTNASEAATQIRGILSSLLNPSKQAADELERLGLSGEMIRQVIKEDGLLAALELLKEKFEGNEEAAALVFGNIRALSGVLDLLGANVDTTRQIFANMNDVAGDTQAAFDVMAQTAQFKLNTAIASAKDGLIDLGNAVMTTLLPVIERISNAIKSLSTWFNGLSPEVQSLVVGIGAVAAAMGPFLYVLGSIATLLPTLIRGFILLNSVLLSNPIVLVVIGMIAFVDTIDKVVEATKKEIDVVKKAIEVNAKFAETLGTVTEQYSQYLTAKENSVKYSKKEADAIIENIKAKKAEVTANRELLEGLRAVENARIKALEKKAGNKGNLSLDEIAELKQRRAAVAEMTATIEASRRSEIEMGAAIAEVTKAIDVSTDAFKAFNPAGKTVGEIETRIDALSTALKGMVPHSKEFNATMAEISRLKQIIDPKEVKEFQELNEVVDLSAGKMAAFQASINSLSKTDNLTPFLNAVAKEFERIDQIGGALGTKSVDLANQKLSFIEKQVIAMIDAGKMGTKEFQELLEMYNRLKGLEGKNPIAQWAEDLDTFSKKMVESVQGMAQGLGMALASNTGDFKSWALSVINTLLQAASAALLAGELIKLGPIGLVTALAGIGILQGIIAGLSNNMNKNVPQFATGGAVTGPTLAMVGENPASRGEAIIPFERMGSFLQQFGMGTNGNQHITISGQLAGDTIRLSGESATNKIASVRWGRGTALVN